MVFVRRLLTSLLLVGVFFAMPFAPTHAASLVIGKLQVTVAAAKDTSMQGKIDITFETNAPTQAYVLLTDQATDYKPSQEMKAYKTSHYFSFTGLPATIFQVSIQVAAEDGTKSEITDRYANTREGTVNVGSPGSTGANGGPCGGVNGDGQLQPACDGETALPPNSGTSSGSGTTGASSGVSYPFTIDAAELPAKLTGPTIRSCYDDIAIVWAAPQPLTGVVTITGIKGDTVETIALDNVNPVVVQLLPTNPSQVYWIGDLNKITPGQEYSVTFTSYDTSHAYEAAQLAGRFTRPTSQTTQSTDCSLEGFGPFLASAGVNMQGPGLVAPGSTNANGSGSNDDTSKTALEKILDTRVSGATSANRISLGDVLYWLSLPLALLSLLVVSYFFVKRRRLWGVVYDARSKMPLELAVVRLFDQEHHKLLETRVTSQSGRYSFLAEPGEYYLEVTKEGFHFPSRIVTSTVDNEYINLYRGEVVKLGAGQSLIAPDIPVDSEAGVVVKGSAFRQILIPFLDKIRLPLLLVSLILVGLLQAASYGDADEGLTSPGTIVFALVILLPALLLIELLMIRRGRK